MLRYSSVLVRSSILLSRQSPFHFCRYSSTIPRPTIASLLHSDSSTLSSAGEGKSLTVNGFVRSIRRQKRFAFVWIVDGSTLKPLQVVLPPELAHGLNFGAAVTVTGEWKESVGAGQSHELHAQEVHIVGENDTWAYPIKNAYQPSESLRAFPHLRTRIPYNSLLLRLRSQAINSVTSFFNKEGFIQTHTPIITSSDCEGAGEAFEVQAGHTRGIDKQEDFFGSPKYLTVSSQLHLEALAQSVGRVWTLSPTFRAERSYTARHLSEFYMLEAEMSFVNSLDDIMNLTERLLKDMTRAVYDSKIGEELLTGLGNNLVGGSTTTLTQGQLLKRWQSLLGGTWPRITYADAIHLLQDAVSKQQAEFEQAPVFGSSFSIEHERYIAETVGQGSPVFVTDYPSSIKAFYMAPSEKNSTETNSKAVEIHPKISTAACFDLLVPEFCEIVGGSMREHRLDHLLRSMKCHGLIKRKVEAQGEEERMPLLDGHTQPNFELNYGEKDIPDNLQWYVDLRRHGSVPHGGFGLGFDRLLCYLSGVSNIRDIVGFPRWYARCEC